VDGEDGDRPPQVIEVPSTRPSAGWWTPSSARPGRPGIGMPEVAVYDAPEINAFATGWNRNDSLVAVSKGCSTT